MYLGFLIVFFLSMVLISLFLSRRVKDSKSFVLADNSLPWYVNATTLIATYVGSGALIGGAALAFDVGYNAIWLYAGGWAAIACLFLMSSKIRKFAGTTTAELIGARYGEKARTIAAIIVLLAETAIVGYNIKGTGWVINITTGTNLNLATIIGAVLIIAFTVIAGLVSVAYTDYIMGLIIIASMLIGLPFALNAAGGWESIKAAIPSNKMSPMSSFSWVYMLKTGLPTLVLVFMGQSFWQRLFAANSPKEAKKASAWWFVGVVAVSSIIMTIAIIGSVMFPNAEPDSIVMVMAKDGLPTFIGIWLLAAAAAILITSADSFLLASATIFMHDIFSKIKPNATDKQKLLTIRLAIVILGLIAYIQVNFFPSILSMIYYAYTMEGGLIIVVLAAFFWKRASIPGGIASITTVGIVTVLWELFKPFGIATIFATLISAILALVVVSLFTSPPEQKYLRRFHQAKDSANNDGIAQGN